MTVNSADTNHVGGKQTRRLSTKAVELLQEHTGNLPVWIRCPRNNSTEFYTGLSRAKMYELAAAGKIVSRSIREPGQIKGTRLFLLSSILDFITACDEGKPEKQIAAAEAKP